MEEIRPVTIIENPELLKELKPWCPTPPENRKTVSYVKAKASCSMLVVLFCFDMMGQTITDPENTNSSGPKCWLKHLIKFCVQDHALD